MPASTLKSAWSEHGLPPRAGGVPLRAIPDHPLQHLAEEAHKAVPKPVRIPRGAKVSAGELQRIMFLGDPHVPYHDAEHLSLWLKACSDFKPHIVVSTGDFLDCFAISSYSKDPRRVLGLKSEIDQAKLLLDQIEEVSPEARRIYISGNHEDRLQRYLQDKAPELFSFIDVPKLLDLHERGWEYVPYREATKIGKLNLTHDVGTAGRNAVFKVLDAFQSPAVTGHTHRFAIVAEGDALGGCMVSAQFGWLGDIKKVDYMHQIRARRDWMPGFGTGYLNPKTGYVYVYGHPIVNGTAVVEGRLYETRRKKAA